MMLKDVTILLGAESPYEFITAPQWVRARRGIRIYHNGTQINVRYRKKDFWFVCNVGIQLKFLRLTKTMSDEFTINQCDANDLLGLPNIVDKTNLKDTPPDYEETMSDSETFFTEQNVKNIAYAMGMFVVATAAVMGVKTAVKVVPKGRSK